MHRVPAIPWHTQLIPGSPRLWEGHGTELPSQTMLGLFFSLKHLNYEKKQKAKGTISCLGMPSAFLPAPATWLPALANKSTQPSVQSVCASPGAALSPARAAAANLRRQAPCELQALLQIKGRNGFPCF